MITHNWQAVGLDVTQHYAIDPADAPHIAQIVEVFFYDRNEHTFCCEMTPSYLLRHLYTTIVFKESTPDNARDELDNRYAHAPTDNAYMHCADVERIAGQVAYGEDATEDEVREYWQGNCPI